MSNQEIQGGPAAAEGPPALSFPARLWGILWNPRATYQDVVRKPNIMAPFLFLVVLHLAASLIVYKPVIQPYQISKATEQNPDLPADRRAAMERGMKGPIGWTIATLLGVGIGTLPCLLWAAVFYFVFTLLLSGRADFRFKSQSFQLCFWPAVSPVR